MEASNKVGKLLSHMNYMRLTLYYTMHPDQMPLGKSLPIWQQGSLQRAEALIDQYGDNPVEKIKDRKCRPTDMRKAQDVISALVLNYEGLFGLFKQLLDGKYDAKTIKEHDLPRYAAELQSLKKGIAES